MIQQTEKKQKILISSLGKSPKTVTEMIGALEFIGVKIDKVVYLSTRGSEFPPEDVLYQKGIPLPEMISFNVTDIRTPPEAIHVQETIFKTIRKLKQNSEIEALYLDMTGGRKEMSAYLMFAAQMLCGPEDHLYHVEVLDEKSPLLLKDSPVWYPSRPDEVGLLEVPFLRLDILYHVLEDECSLKKEVGQETSASDLLQKSDLCG